MSRVIYEVNLRIASGDDEDAPDGPDVDAWLSGHVDAMLGLPGFVSAEVLTPAGTTTGEAIERTVQYVLSSREALDDYLANDAERMRADGVERFGERLSASRRVLDKTGELIGPRCLNCDSPLVGQYCDQCGQRASTRLISLWQLIRDALGDLLEADSRFWRTLNVLVFQPGTLTAEYLRGRRASYMPPFRMYLVVSLLFFLFTSLTSDGDDIRATIKDDTTGTVIERADDSTGQSADDDEDRELQIGSWITVHMPPDATQPCTAECCAGRSRASRPPSRSPNAASACGATASGASTRRRSTSFRPRCSSSCR